ncbi:hypothetical protein [Candidatus Halobonum tyrrellensis]|uniref:Uncharacterized protein n=1 Tax=Candidatus Halobonum tyrrellensis G22 TaxID=1324957 RepID=V4HKP5_9EURY|nr:hypothetical protein [Candidatus Halobonum tyrrellensis]ESP88499.1 hypothetical protein K933_08567 [Candidatus Halobonum tyrrellensis G22]
MRGSTTAVTLGVGVVAAVPLLDVVAGNGFEDPSYALGYAGTVVLFVGWVAMFAGSLLVAYRDDPPALARPAVVFGTVLVVGAVLLVVSRFDCVFSACPV